GTGPVAEDPAKLLVYRAVPLAVAPGGHDDRAGDDARPLLARPLDRVEKGARLVGLPVGQQQFGLGGERVNDLAAEDAVLAVLGFEVAIAPERFRRELRGDGLALVVLVAAKAGIEDGDLEPHPLVALRVPGLDAEPREVLLARPRGRAVERR